MDRVNVMGYDELWPENMSTAGEIEIAAEEIVAGTSDLVPTIEKAAHNLSSILQSFPGFTINSFKEYHRAISHYTGFSSYSHFRMFFSLLGPCVNHVLLSCKMLDPENQLFLTLMKLRQAKEDIELSILFKIHKATVLKIVITWINFMYFQLKEIDIWPSREIATETMPSGFKKEFPHTRVILDATEIPIDKPINVEAQSASFSTYKNRNTAKAIIGISPKGVVTFVSDAYAGSASDRQIVEQSALYLNAESMFSPGDGIMADRGLMVQDLFAPHDITVNTPTMLKGKSQLEPGEVMHDRKVASKRIHVERIIGLGKTYKILTEPLGHTKAILASRIISICYFLSNCRENIVSDEA